MRATRRGPRCARHAVLHGARDPREPGRPGRAELERLVQGTGAVTITADETVDRGGCVLLSPVGEVDARISTKLSVLETAFAAQRRRLASDS